MDTRKSDKPRVVKRYQVVCGFTPCDEEMPTQVTESAAIRRAADHAVERGHVRVRQVQVERIREVVRERIIEPTGVAK